MSLPLSFNRNVKDDIENGFRWYEQRRAGLGRDFANEVVRVLDEIVANPSRYGFAEADIREGLLNRFPYAIYYRVLSDRIRVLAVWHAAKDPAGWKSRS